MIRDPERRGERLAQFHGAIAPRLWQDLLDSGVLPFAGPGERDRQRAEWDDLCLHACVRGLVAAGGFGEDTAVAIDALHRAVLEARMRGDAIEPFETARDRLAERYAEYGDIARRQDGAPGLAEAIGDAAGRHLVEAPSDELAQLVGGLYEVMTDGAAEAVRQGEPAASAGAGDEGAAHDRARHDPRRGEAPA